MGVGTGSFVADLLGATLATTAGDNEVCNDVGGGGKIGDGAGGLVLSVGSRTSNNWES